MNRSEIKTTIKDSMQLDPGLVSNRERERYIRDTINDLSSLGVWEGAYEVTTATAPVTLPTTFSSLVEAYWNGKRLRKMDKRKLDGTIPAGQPLYCWTAIDPADGVYKLFTYPQINMSGKVKIDFSSKAIDIPTDSTGTGTDQNDLTTYGVPSEWHGIIADGATAMAHRKNGNYTAAKEYQTTYMTGKNTLYIAALERINSRPVENDVDEINPYAPDTFIPPTY